LNIDERLEGFLSRIDEWIDNKNLGSPPFDEKFKVLLQDTAVDISFVHDMGQFERPSLGQNFEDVNVHFELGPTQI